MTLVAFEYGAKALGFALLLDQSAEADWNNDVELQQKKATEADWNNYVEL